MKKMLAYLFESITNDKHLERLFEIKYFPNAEKDNCEQFIWNEIVKAVKDAKQKGEMQLIISKNTKAFKNSSNEGAIIKLIGEATNFNAKLLIGNIAANDATLVPLSSNLCWTDSVTNLDFIVIYNSCFELILNEDFSQYSSVIECFENLTSNKILIYPMMDGFNQGLPDEKMRSRMDRLMRIRIQLREKKLKPLDND